MLALLPYSYANRIFSSCRIKRATHPDHDTIAVFRRANKAAFEAAFLHVLLLAHESGLLRVGTVSIDDIKIDANASKIRSLRYDYAKALRAKLVTDIVVVAAEAEAARPTYETKKAIYDAKKGPSRRPARATRQRSAALTPEQPDRPEQRVDASFGCP